MKCLPSPLAKQRGLKVVQEDSFKIFWSAIVDIKFCESLYVNNTKSHDAIRKIIDYLFYYKIL